MSSSGSADPIRPNAPTAPALDDAAVIARVQMGDLGAFESLVRTWAKPLIAFAGALLRSPQDAEEVVQDLFVWIWEHRFEWEVQGALGAYLYRSVRNRAVSRMRHQQVEDRFQHRLAGEAERRSPSSSSPAEQELATDELSAAIDAAIARLSDRCREVFLLNRQRGLSYAQVADTLQISVKTVEIHMTRALAALRQALAPWRTD
jgi:RNA polymerase sigma-70 factor (ECF subfamily)